MLTYHDRTTHNAAQCFKQCKDASAEYWGIKEEGLPLPQMQELYREFRQCGKKTVLEVVAYTESQCLKGAEMAAACGCDLLMGTVFFDSVNAFCQQNNIKYMPFVGEVSGRPSVLNGDIDDMIRQAESYLQKGVFGIDLLAYRYTGDSSKLIRKFVSEVKAPVCIAGSVNSFRHLDEIKSVSPWAFTIGSAFFDHDFGSGFQQQINRISDYMKETVNV